MKSTEEVKTEIADLTPEEKFELAQWLYDIVNQDDDWDRQMKADAAAGKLDFLIEEVDRDIREGKTLPWPESDSTERASSDLDRITFDRQIMGGKACIRGMRIPVSVVLKLLAGGMSKDQILADYPDLEPEDIDQSVRYAAMLVDKRALRAGA